MATNDNPFAVKPTPGAANAQAQTDYSAAATKAATPTPKPDAGLIGNAMAQPAATVAAPAAPASTPWKVTSDQTVAGQLDKVLDPGSQTMQRAQAGATQTANSRGLINSSMAAGAGQAAMIDAGLEIARPDAATNAQAAQYNADTTNKLAAQSFDQQFKATLANADNATKLQLQQLDTNARMGLAQVEAQYKTLMQANQSAGDLYQQTVKAINELMLNKDLDPDAKAKAIADQTRMLQTGFAVFGKMNNLDLTSLLDFSGVQSAQQAGPEPETPAEERADSASRFAGAPDPANQP